MAAANHKFNSGGVDGDDGGPVSDRGRSRNRESGGDRQRRRRYGGSDGGIRQVSGGSRRRQRWSVVVAGYSWCSGQIWDMFRASRFGSSPILGSGYVGKQKGVVSASAQSSGQRLGQAVNGSGQRSYLFGSNSEFVRELRCGQRGHIRF
ncbi:hypothetical protein HanPI659440_Chr04g0156631 [Helianthus annuus]|nr:hypothetical protein HanPI659440_Chr04g0156631 [Helianthus annuus]